MLVLTRPGSPGPGRVRVEGPRRLALRPLRARDAAGYAALTQRPEVARLALRGRRPRAAVARGIAAASQQCWRQRGTGLWLATPATDRRRVLAACGLSWIVGLGRFELSFCLAPALWGQGIATAIVATVLREADRRHPGAPVFALTDPANAAAQRVLRKAGFDLRAELRHAGRPACYFVRRAGAAERMPGLEPQSSDAAAERPDPDPDHEPVSSGSRPAART